MGNAPSSSTKSSSSSGGRKSGSSSGKKGSSNTSNSNSKHTPLEDGDIAGRAQKAVGDFQAGISSSIKKLEEQDHPAATLIDTVCGPYLDGDKYGQTTAAASSSFYSEAEESEEDSLPVSDEETDASTDYRNSRGGNRSSRNSNNRNNRRNNKQDYSVDSQSYLSTDYDEVTVETEDTRLDNNNNRHNRRGDHETNTTKGTTIVTTTAGNMTPTGNNNNNNNTASFATPMASSFAKRCYFTKAGIGKTTQHYEGLTLTGNNIVLMLAAAMKLKGCPTICDEDLRRVEQTYPNQFSRLPDELLLSSGWRRISKYCHFSNKPVPDGIPFFHSKQRMHPSGGYYFLLAAAVGMVRPIDVEPLNRDTLVLLETDFPTTCDAAPPILIKDPAQWTLVDKFCFFSGGPINTEEDVYYQADFDGNPIYMLAFLSPSLTPNELYKLDGEAGAAGLKNVAAVQEVESVYDLTERDFDDLKLYHLGPCRALPQYILQPQAWTKVLPPHFLAARQQALMLAHEYEGHDGVGGPGPTHMATAAIHNQHSQQQQQQQQLSIGSQRGRFMEDHGGMVPHYEQQPHHHHYAQQQQQQGYYEDEQAYGNAYQQHDPSQISANPDEFQRDVEEEGAFSDPNIPIDEAIAAHAASLNRPAAIAGQKMDPPDDDEPPSLSKRAAAAAAVADVAPESGYQYQSKEGGHYSVGSGSDDPSNPTYFSEGDNYNFSNSTDDKVDYYENPEGGKYFASQSQEDAVAFEPEPDVGDEEMMSPQGSGEDGLEGKSHLPFDRPPMSPRSPQGEGSEFSQSSAMKGAQEMLKRNRQRRLETARLIREEHALQQHQLEEDIDKQMTITESESGVTWDSGSEVTSVVSGSSVWTDNSNNPDRSSRRALILQMAKARMKSNKPPETGDKEGNGLEGFVEEEKKELELDVLADTATDIDIAEDLD